MIECKERGEAVILTKTIVFLIQEQKIYLMFCISTLLIFETSNAVISETCAFTDGGRGMPEDVKKF